MVFFPKTTPSLKNKEQKYIKQGKPSGTVHKGELDLGVKNDWAWQWRKHLCVESYSQFISTIMISTQGSDVPRPRYSQYSKHCRQLGSREYTITFEGQSIGDGYPLLLPKAQGPPLHMTGGASPVMSDFSGPGGSISINTTARSGEQI